MFGFVHSFLEVCRERGPFECPLWAGVLVEVQLDGSGGSNGQGVLACFRFGKHHGHQITCFSSSTLLPQCRITRDVSWETPNTQALAPLTSRCSCRVQAHGSCLGSPSRCCFYCLPFCPSGLFLAKLGFRHRCSWAQDVGCLHPAWPCLFIPLLPQVFPSFFPAGGVGHNWSLFCSG